MLRMLRLSLFSKIVHKKHYHLLSLLYLARNRDRSYIKSLQNDFRTLCNIGTTFEYARNWDMSRWVRYIEDHYVSYNRQIRIVLSSSEATQYIYIYICRPKPTGNIAPSPEISLHPCDLCGKVLGTYQQLQLHMFSKHDWLHPADLLTHETHCSICLTQFHTRSRLLEHLKYKGARFQCFRTLSSSGPSITYQYARQLNQQEAILNKALAHKGLRRSYARKPAHRTPGPLPKRGKSRIANS